MAFECSILADSINTGTRLTTFQVRFPRFILAEVNTHRMLSRNFESSRAISVEERINQVAMDPFVPLAFGSKTRKMQAGPDLEGDAAQRAEDLWRVAADDACFRARALSECGVHKQLANRVLEPFAWVSGIITATEWDNFFALRIHPAVQPEFQHLARMMRTAMDASAPVERTSHTPLAPEVTEDYEYADAAMLSAGRCSRVSYNRPGRSCAEDMAHAEFLLDSGHMSPFEHSARAHPEIPAGAAGIVSRGNFRYPWFQFRKTIFGEDVFRG
jgi:thymidylate synthase ThyX